MKLYEIEQMTVAAKVNPPQTTNPVLIEARLEKMKEDKESTDPDPTKKAKEDAARAKKHLVQEFGQTKGKFLLRVIRMSLLSTFLAFLAFSQNLSSTIEDHKMLT